MMRTALDEFNEKKSMVEVKKVSQYQMQSTGLLKRGWMLTLTHYFQAGAAYYQKTNVL